MCTAGCRAGAVWLGDLSDTFFERKGWGVITVQERRRALALEQAEASARQALSVLQAQHDPVNISLGD